MKKILVVDASQAVRETIHLVLERDYAVAQRPSLEGAGEPDADLLIVGSVAAPAATTSDQGGAESYSCPVLFLVDTLPAAAASPPRGRDWLAKPFNPYELRQKIAALIGGVDAPPDRMPGAAGVTGKTLRYLDYPYVPAAVPPLARRFAAAPLPLLILAEPGSGQESLARAIHAHGDRPGPCLTVHAAEAGRLGARLAAAGGRERATIYLSHLDRLDFSAQSALLDLLAEQEGRRELRLISNSRVDLLEKVYRGEFLDALYYRLATLLLRLPPLRDRQSDIPALALRLAEECAGGLGMRKVQFSPAALERLRHYLWFGNVDEMEAVISRTLATHGKELIDAPDLVLGEEGWVPAAAEPPDAPKANAAPAVLPPQYKKSRDVSVWSNGYSQEIRVLIGELAHELKNPMVTVKTFSQLLADRFDDPTFRVRFQQTVNGDIQRMDDLLESLLDFSHFNQPAGEKILLYEQLRRVEEELLPECIKRETALQWGKRGESAVVFVDRAQFLFAFKNILRAALAQVKPKSEIHVDVEGGGRVAISYARESAGVGAPSEFLGAAAGSGEEALPLRFLLANILLERNGGAVTVDYSDGSRARIRAELPAADKRGLEETP